MMSTSETKLYLALRAGDPTNQNLLRLSFSADGTEFQTPPWRLVGIELSGDPGIAAFSSQLYIAFRANDTSNQLFVTSSNNGADFKSPATGYSGIKMGGDPAMAVFKNRLYIAFRTEDSSKKILLTSSANGTNFQSPAGYSGIIIGGSPALAAVPPPVAPWRFIGNSGVVGIHAALLSTNQLLFWERPENPPNPNTIPPGELSAIFDLAGGREGQYTSLHIERNAFCAGHTSLPDGRLLVAGGDTMGIDGLDALRVFTPEVSGPGLWSDIGVISGKRWYPTCVTMPDGRAFVVSGTTDDLDPNKPGLLNPTFEIIPPLPSGPQRLELLVDAYPYSLYPFVHVLPSGWLFHFVGDKTCFINMSTWSIDTRGIAALPPYPRCYRNSATSVLLPLSPATNYDAEVMILGGGGSALYNSPSTTRAVNTYARMRVNESSPKWSPLASMPHARVMPDAVLLPDGKVLVVNGAAEGFAGGAAGQGSAKDPVFPADLYDPATDTWRTLDSAQAPRLYHSTALLLPDGRVMCAGCDQALSDVPTHPYEYRVETFSPPYLSAASRPVVAQAPARISYGSTFIVQLAAAMPTVDRATLLRNGTTTHSNHMDQRFVELVIAQKAATSLTLQAPPNAAIAPPGDYMLFLLSQGVPSVATFVRLAVTPSTSPSTGLSGWWMLNEPSGSKVAPDSSGNTNKGDLTGSASFSPGRAGSNALLLDGQGAMQASAKPLPSGRTPHTIALWFKLSALPAAGAGVTLLCWGQPNPGNACGLSIRQTADGKHTFLRFFGWAADIDAWAALALTPGIMPSPRTTAASQPFTLTAAC